MALEPNFLFFFTFTNIHSQRKIWTSNQEQGGQNNSKLSKIKEKNQLIYIFYNTKDMLVTQGTSLFN